MTIDPNVLSATIVSSFLVPYAKAGFDLVAEQLTDEANKQLSKAAIEHVKTLSRKVWDRVKAAFVSDGDEAIFTQFEKHPEAAQALLEKLLGQKFEEQEALANELHGLINAPGPEGTGSGAQIMNANHAFIMDLRNADFSHAKKPEVVGQKIYLGTPSSQTEQ